MQNEKQVNDAADMYNGYAFDKNHTLAAINLENFDTVLSSEDNYEQPTRDDGADVVSCYMRSVELCFQCCINDRDEQISLCLVGDQHNLFISLSHCSVTDF